MNNTQQIKDILDKHNSWFDVQDILELLFPDKTYLSKRLHKLLQNADIDINILYETSINSLKSLIYLLYIIRDFNKPVITFDDDRGLFQISWKLDIRNLITVNFKTEYEVDFVIFKPILYSDKTTTLTGHTTILEFIKLIDLLELEYIFKENIEQ